MQPSILLIDDDPFIGPLLDVFLRKKGFDLTVAKTGEQGLTWLEQNHFNLVLLDLDLPDMPGMEVLRQINDGRPAPPVLVITDDRVGGAEALKALRLGAAGVLRKPFQLSALHGEMCHFLGCRPNDLALELRAKWT